MIQTPTKVCVDGLRLDRFRVGVQYEVGFLLAAYLLAEGWAEPHVTDGPAVAIAVSELETKTPANLVRELYPPYYDGPQLRRPERRKRRRPAGH
jgi:hypothetical protein